MDKSNTVPKSTWAQIKKEYVTGNVSMRELSRKYSLSVSTISARAKKDGWKELVEQTRVLSEQKLVERVAESQASNAELGQQIINTLMSKLASAAEKVKPENTKSIRMITQCMKDLKDMSVYGIDEQGAKDIEIIFGNEETSEYGE